MIDRKELRPAATGPVVASVGVAHRRLVEVAARAVGLRVEHVDGDGFFAAARRADVALMVTDVMRKDGELRVPILALVRGGLRAKIDALAGGAAEVVGVPFDIDELAVRMAAAVGRSTGAYPSSTVRIELGPMHLDLEDGRLKRDGHELNLSPLEQRILLVLAANDGEVAEREQILEAVWGPGIQPQSNLIDRHIRDLRRKLADEWRRPSYIVTVRGQGYSFRKAGTDTNTRLD